MVGNEEGCMCLVGGEGTAVLVSNVEKVQISFT